MKINAFAFDAYGTLFDVHSVLEITEQEYPGKGSLITQVWRLKQLEYTWLRTCMDAYKTFWEVSEESLRYTLNSLCIEHDADKFARIMDKYLHLEPYPDCKSALDSLKAKGKPLAILSNGNQSMLDDLVLNTGLDTVLDEVISVDDKKKAKPHPSVYELVEKRLGVPASETVFVSSNSFDACAAKNFGFQVAWIERVTPEMLAAEINASEVVNPDTMYKILRTQQEQFDMDPMYKLKSLSDLINLL